jgi:hypothetical protein
MKITEEQAKQIVKDLLATTNNRFKQELEGENEEFLDRIVRQYRAKLARYSWKFSQKWSKWNNEGPVLMPDFTRIYYRKGNTEVVLQEFHPQRRYMKFKTALAKRKNSSDPITSESSTSHGYNLSLPYMVFIFKFVNGLFTEVRCAFSDRALKRLEEKPYRPYLSNIDSNLMLCLGGSFDKSKLEKDNIAQQCSFVLDYFWSSVYSDEWSSHFWASKAHFEQTNKKLATLEAWEENSLDNPLFAVEGIKWLPHTEESFGDIIVRMLDGDKKNDEMQEEIYQELTTDFLKDAAKTFNDNIDSVTKKAAEASIEQLSKDLVEKLKSL